MLFCLDDLGKKTHRDVINFSILLLFLRHYGRFCSTLWERDAKNHANSLRVPVT